MGQERATHKVPGKIDWLSVWTTEGRRAILWLPVLMGCGIWLYMAFDREPNPLWCALTIAPAMALASGIARRAGFTVLAPTLALAALCAGYSLATLAAYRAQAPVLSGPIEQTIEGRVRGLSKAASGAPRVLFDRVIVYCLDAVETPERFRVTLLAAERGNAPRPGTPIRVFARLLPPGDPVEPGAFDFRLRAYFENLGAVGYARGAALAVGEAEFSGPVDRFMLWLADRRARLSDALTRALPGRRGAFAAAIIVGDRSNIDQADAEALRISSLAHLLAISGLHMGLLTGLVFAAVRLFLAVCPITLSGVTAKKADAIVALSAGLGYLMLSGATVATQRAFVMMAVPSQRYCWIARRSRCGGWRWRQPWFCDPPGQFDGCRLPDELCRHRRTGRRL